MFATKTISRRDSLVFGSLAGFGLAAANGKRASAGPSDTLGSAKRCVLVWLDGGPSHLETFDPKPEAAEEVRGPLGVINTRHAGVVFSAGLPQLAQRVDQFTVIRSMTSPVGEHNLATHYALTGHIPGGRAVAPAFTLPVSTKLQTAGPPLSSLPIHVAVPNFNLGGGAKLNGFLDRATLPWTLGSDAGDKDFLQRLWPSSPGLDIERLQRRRELLGDAGDQALASAIDLLSDPNVRRTFDISQESAKTRQRYGGKPIGQNCLLARRLLEAGIPIVTLNNKGWDTHDRLRDRLYDGYTGAATPVGLVPSLDQAIAALLDDLSSTGLIDDTLVVVMGEFGRTPKINSLGGRDHWSRAYSVLLAGAGIQPGAIYGSSDRVGETAHEDPVTPADLVATLYHLLGVDPAERIATPDGQQMRRTPEESHIVTSILA
ncbi:MAG: DUF1501 domain-containing protein [Pirellulaceae bacterium]